MKKVKISLVLVFVILLFNIACMNQVNAASSVVANGEAGTSITSSLDSNGVLTLSGSGTMTNSTESPWADYQVQVKSVKFDGNITSIGRYAFKDNTNLKSVELPSKLTSIGNYAFYGCTNLKSVTFPNTLSSVGAYSFYKCTSLQEADLKSTIRSIGTYAFAECTSLKSVKIGEFYCNISDYSTTISDTATIYGYHYSTVQAYARHYGRTFHDLSTGEETKKTVTNKMYLDALPTTNVKALGHTAHHGRSLSGHTFEGYTSELLFEKDTTNEDYKKIKAKVDEITADCKTDEEKAKAIVRWVYLNVDYVGATAAYARPATLYYYFNKQKGNCEVYTLLTNYMLYLCDIPTATATSLTHMWSAAYINGKWIYLDPTGGIYNATTGRTYQISFAYDGFVYVIDDPTDGAFVTGIAKDDDYIKSLTSFTIPTNSYMKGIYPTSFPRDIELRAKVGTIAETFIRNNRRYCEVENNEIIGTNEYKTEISSCRIELETEQLKYKGNYKEPGVTVKYGTTILNKGTDYTVEYSNNKNTGKATVIIKGKGNYTGTVTKNFRIIPAAIQGLKVIGQNTKKITLQWTASGGKITAYKVYQFNPNTKAYDIYLGKTSGTIYKISGLKAGTEYRFKVRAYKNIDGVQYFGPDQRLTTSTQTATPQISGLTAGSKQMTIKWGKISGAVKYVIDYATKSDFSNAVTVTRSASKSSATIGSLKSGKKYYVRIRTYTSCKVYSEYSSVKSVKVK